MLANNIVIIEEEQCKKNRSWRPFFCGKEGTRQERRNE